MALTVISQHYYKDNQLQFMSCVIDVPLFNSAYSQLLEYLNNASSETAPEKNIESLTVAKIRKFNGVPPHYPNGGNLKQGGFMVTVTFSRPEDTAT